MSQVHIVYEMEEEDSGGRYQPSLYIKQVIGVYADKDKAIADTWNLISWRLGDVRAERDVRVTDRFVNGVEQDIMYWSEGEAIWEEEILYKLETRTLIDWE